MVNQNREGIVVFLLVLFLLAGVYGYFHRSYLQCLLSRKAHGINPVPAQTVFYPVPSVVSKIVRRYNIVNLYM